MSEAREIETTETDPPAEGDSAPPKEPTIEERARLMGWRPKEEFRGSPDMWTDAQTWVRRAENEMPIMRSTLTKLERELSRLGNDNKDLKTQLGETKQVLTEYREFASRAEQRAYERAKRELEQELVTQKKAGDVDGVERTTRELADLETTKPAATAPRTETRAEPKREEKPPATQEKPPEVEPEVLEWVRNNQWFDRASPAFDAELNLEATNLHGVLLRTRPNLTLAENLAEVSRRIRLSNPEKFQNARRNTKAATVSEPSGDTPRRTNGHTFADLPADAKAAFQRFKKAMPKFTEAEYLAQYQWE